MKQVLSILFADVVGFSSLDTEDKKVTLSEIIQGFRDRYLNSENHTFFKTWGDGIPLVCLDPIDMAELALDLKDYFRNMNWKRAGFSEALELRIAINLARVSVQYEGNKVSDVIGTGVDLTARIEPIVKPNCIFCTSPFKGMIESNEHNNYQFVQLGNLELAKEYGSSELFELLRLSDNTVNTARPINDITEQISTNIVMPNIRRNFSDLDKQVFVEQGLGYSKEYLEKALRQLEHQSSDVKLSFDIAVVEKERLTVIVFVDGNQKGYLDVWFAKDYGFGELRFSTSRGLSGNSYNGAFYVEDDGFQINWSNPMIGFMSSTALHEDKSSHEYLGQILWHQLSNQLES